MGTGASLRSFAVLIVVKHCISLFPCLGDLCHFYSLLEPPGCSLMFAYFNCEARRFISLFASFCSLLSSWSLYVLQQFPGALLSLVLLQVICHSVACFFAYHYQRICEEKCSCSSSPRSAILFGLNSLDHTPAHKAPSFFGTWKLMVYVKSFNGYSNFLLLDHSAVFLEGCLVL